MNRPDNGIPADKIVLQPQGLTTDQRKAVYEAYKGYLKNQYENFMGYQTNQKLEDEELLAPFLKIHVNRDPFTGGGYMMNSKQMESALLDYFAELWHAKHPHDPKDGETYWGYVLSMGSTEGNMYGLWQARDYLQGKTLYHEPDSTFAAAAKNCKHRGGDTYVPLLYKRSRGSKIGNEKNSRKPIAFFSEDTHYSITKICRVLELPTFYDIGTEQYPNECPLGDEWPQTVPSTEEGTIDVEKLFKLVEFFAKKGYPPLIVFNVGSTFKGAHDPVEEAGNRLVSMLKLYGLDERKVEYSDGRFDVRTGYWIHVDAALGGTYVPLIFRAQKQGLYKGPMPQRFDFELPFVHSINTSGHKWPGVPWPCGLFMTKVKYQIKPPSNPTYIASPDTTFAGSRNGFSAVILWDFYARYSLDHLTKSIAKGEELTEYAYNQLHALSQTLGGKYGHAEDKDFLWAARSTAAITVRFRAPVTAVINKYSLSTESMYVHADGKSVKRDYAHIYIMHHTEKALIDQLLADLAKDGAFSLESEVPVHVEIASADHHGSAQQSAVLRTSLPILTIKTGHDGHAPTTHHQHHANRRGF